MAPANPSSELGPSITAVMVTADAISAQIDPLIQEVESRVGHYMSGVR
jgi:hypothetical protein